MKKFYLLGLLVFIFSASVPAAGGAIISENLLKEASLQTIWTNGLSLDPKEKIRRVTVLGNYLYILTDRNYLFCLDRNSGRLSFAEPVAAAKLPVFEPVNYNGITYIIAADYLIAASTEQGVELYRTKLSVSVSATAAVNAGHLYVPATDKYLHIIDPNGKLERFKAGAENGSAITSVLATDDYAVFATTAGNVICMGPSSPKRLWYFDAVGAITAPLVRDANALYVSSKDTNLYKLDAGSGKMIWKFRSGSALNTSARVTDTAVYQYARDKGLYAIDANSGKQLWILPEGLDLLAQDGNTAYVFDKDNTCSVMDNKKAKKIYTINFAKVSSYAANILDNKIYIMENKNICCIEPIKK